MNKETRQLIEYLNFECYLIELLDELNIENSL